MELESGLVTTIAMVRMARIKREVVKGSTRIKCYNTPFTFYQNRFVRINSSVYLMKNIPIYLEFNQNRFVGTGLSILSSIFLNFLRTVPFT